MSLLGIDIGTSGCKATVIDEDGNCLGQASREYSLISAQPGWQELDPEEVWTAVREVVRRAVASHSGDPVRAIGVSSFGEAVTAIDRNGNALCNSMIYIDARGKEEAAFLERRLGNAKILGITGTTALPMYSIAKIMWQKQHRPEQYRNTWKYLPFSAFILLKLGAAPHTDYSLAARTMAFDIIGKQWSSEILDASGVERDKFGEPVQAGTPVGKLTDALSDELGLPKNCLLVAGGHDQPCAALGAGVIRPGLAVDGLGTVECITPAFDRPILSESMSGNYFACVPHVVKDMYVTYAFTFTSGSMLKWYGDQFGQAWQEEARRSGVNPYEHMISKATKNPSPVFVLPHFAGAATPYMDTQAQGAMIGLNINTTSEDIFKAVLEGITFEMMVNVERLAEAGVIVDELMTVGGLAKSELFLQLKADMMGRKVTTLNISEAGTMGVAMLAGAAAGIYGNLEVAVERLVKKKREFYPDPVLHAHYQERFATYRKIYPAVKGIYGRMQA
jgi:xylulokinase